MRQLFRIAIILILITACQAQEATPVSPPPEPTILLIPPIPPGDGSDVMDRLLETGVVRVGLRVWPEAEYAPPAFRGASNAVTGGALTGYAVDVAHALAENYTVDLELVEAYPPAILNGDWRGEWDVALASMVPFDQAPPEMRFSVAYAYMPVGILVPAESNITSMADLAGRRVGVLEDSAYARLLTEPDLTIEGQPVPSAVPAEAEVVLVSNLILTMEEMVNPQEADGEPVDAVFGPLPIFQQAIQAGSPSRIVTGENVTVLPFSIAVMPQDGLAVERLVGETNRIIERLRRQGTLSEIYLRWYGQDWSRFPELTPETQ